MASAFVTRAAGAGCVTSEIRPDNLSHLGGVLRIGRGRFAESPRSMAGIGAITEIMIPNDETQSLIASVRDKRPGALERLFSEHRDYLKRVVDLRMDRQTRRRLDPSDIVQETLVEALRLVDDFVEDPVMPVHLWLRKLAVGRLVMAQRQHLGAGKRTMRREIDLPEHSSLSIAQQLVAGIASPSMASSRREIARIVRDAMSQLREIDREIILLQTFEGLNSTDAAQVLGIEPAAIRQRYGRALLRLRDLLIKCGLKGADS